MNNPLKVLEYESTKITFQTVNGFVMVNATEMAKKFNKEPFSFLRTKQIKDYIEILKQSADLRSEQIVNVENGGANPGTWLHELLALRFAQWLSPHFSIWVDKQIKELLTAPNQSQTLEPEPKKQKSLPILVNRVKSIFYAFVVRVEIYENGDRAFLLGFF